MDAKRVFDEALRLPADARVALAGELLASVEADDVDPGREAAWADEIRRRLDEYDRGEAEAIPAEEVLTELDAAARGDARLKAAG